MRWFGHLVRMPPGRLPVQISRAQPTGRRPWCRHINLLRYYIPHLALEHFGIPQEELDDMARKDALPTSLSLLPPPTWTQISGGCVHIVHVVCSSYCKS